MFVCEKPTAHTHTLTSHSTVYTHLSWSQVGSPRVVYHLHYGTEHHLKEVVNEPYDALSSSTLVVAP